MKRYIFIALIVLALLLYACTPRLAPVQPTAEEPSQAPLAPQTPVAIETPEKITGISITLLPDLAKSGEDVKASWAVSSDGPMTVTHTAIHYGVISQPEAFGLEVTPAQADYLYRTEAYANKESNIPQEFTDMLKIPDGAKMIYLRAHVIADGKNYWTGERSFDVVPAVLVNPGVASAGDMMYSIDIGPQGFSNNGILVKRGDRVEITFNAGMSGVPPEGYEVRSMIWGTTGPIRAGESKTVRFVANQAQFYELYNSGDGELIDRGTLTVST